MFGFKKSKRYQMDIKTADQMLQNVFAACDTTPNKVPFDKIVLRNKTDVRSERLLIIFTALLFILTLVTPLFLPKGSAFVSVDSTMGRPLTVVSHEMQDSAFLITFEGNNLDLSSCYMEASDGTVVYAVSYDEETNTVTFPYDKKEYNIYVYDVSGKCIHLLLTPRK